MNSIHVQISSASKKFMTKTVMVEDAKKIRLARGAKDTDGKQTLYQNGPSVAPADRILSTDFKITLTMTSFLKKLETRVESVQSLLCVGLDPHEKEAFGDNVPADDAARCAAALAFCQRLVTATLPHAACYKPNAAFFEALGDGGMETLRKLCKDVIPDDVPVLLDVKRGDIGSTAAAYAQACYEHLGADAVTLSPLMGWDSVSPFVTGKCNYVLNGGYW